jgi:hypothetical protein
MRSLFLGLIFGLSISFCFAQTKSSIDIQSVQTRTYDYPEKATLRAVISVLQNNQFDNLRSDGNTGLVTAQLPSRWAGDSEQEQVGKVVASTVLDIFVPFGGLLVPSSKSGDKTQTVSVTVEEIYAGKTKVRVLLKETTRIISYGLFGSRNEEVTENDMTSTPFVYQKIFAEIDKEIFVRQGAYSNSTPTTKPDDLSKAPVPITTLDTELKKSDLVSAPSQTKAEERLRAVKDLFDKNLISEAEYKSKMNEILKSF